MADHYYSKTPTSAHQFAQIPYSYRGHSLTFETDSGVFSRTEIDQGSDILLNALPTDMQGEVLDMGCGYGVIGIAVCKNQKDCTLTMVDVNERAVELSKRNAERNGLSATCFQSDGYQSVALSPYEYILQNPPIRAGKAVIYQMFADASLRLSETGSLWLVIRKQQGAPSAKTYLQTLFADVSVVEKKHGFWIFRCQTPTQNATSEEL